MESICDQLASSKRVRDFVLYEVLGAIANNDTRTQLAKIFDFVKAKVIYIKDPKGFELIQSPVAMIDRIEKTGHVYGDCDDHVVLLNSMLATIGFECVPMGVKLHGSSYYNHVISGVIVRGELVELDPCAKNKPPPLYNDRLLAAL